MKKSESNCLYPVFWGGMILYSFIQRNNPKLKKLRNKIAKKDSLRKFTLEMQYAKRKGWENFCSEMQDLSTNSKISKILEIDDKKEIGVSHTH